MKKNELAEKIHQLAEKYSHYTASNLAELVRIKSLSGEEGNVQKALMRQMKEAGFEEIRLDGLGNVIGRIGHGPVILAIDGHIDTVDVGNAANWDKAPFSGEITDGFVWGRGTVDQKGGVASFVTAGRILKEIGVPGNLTLYCTATVMEEDCDGLCWKYLIEEEGLCPHFAISTEPTNLNVYRGHRGRMEIRVTFRGISAHGSAPERGKNAIYMASRAALKIEELNERLRDDEFLGKGSVTISEFVSGSPSLCAVADYAHIHLDRRLTWGETKESAIAEVEEAVKGLDANVEVLWYDGKAFTGKSYGMEKYYPTWKIAEDQPIVQTGVQTFRELFNHEPLVGKWTFSTNGIAINGMHGIPTIGFGPGNEVMAHAPNEKTPVSDLVAAAAFYALFACKL
ncbi:MAG TPA: YgeY family selenium metabolism-linked hydrolase [Bacteroidales bacterium]|nr:MAG: selenium metabolism hydrolase [Bacteroidetes bacterium GWE2_42_24]OFY26453.1 MAG: selenium metabolism hydrolase [Bacteroidetes bacterium GWF2_43_11]HAQ65469.1 YgeY family selenium metabolism-linked hydrolase [Bacteroidales bacterium]HBZ68146.1 YgeY family selenium metabolism-linked hydrolase [Bacteroidales bacterium]